MPATSTPEARAAPAPKSGKASAQPETPIWFQALRTSPHYSDFREPGVASRKCVRTKVLAALLGSVKAPTRYDGTIDTRDHQTPARQSPGVAGMTTCPLLAQAVQCRSVHRNKP